MKKTQYQVNDTVYFLLSSTEESTRGKVIEVSEEDIIGFRGVKVRFDKNIEAVEYLIFSKDGKLHIDAPSSRLSFTPYNIHTGGFSQERPKKLPKEGQLVYVRNESGNDYRICWNIRFFRGFGLSGKIICDTGSVLSARFASEEWDEWQLENPFEGEK